MKKVLHLNVKIYVAFIIAAITLNTNQANAQDPELSQFFAAPLYTNPAMAGTGSCGGRITLNTRNQWPTLDGTFRTMVAAYDEHFNGISGGIGIMAMRDVAGQGLLTTQQFSAAYSYFLVPNVRSKLNIRLGLQADFMQKSLDFNKLIFSDQISPTQGVIRDSKEPIPNQSVTYPNFSTGLLMYTDKFYGGVAIHNLTEPNQSFYNSPDEVLPRRYTAHAGMNIELDKGRRHQSNNSISPNMLFMLQQKFTQMNFGFYHNRGPLISGIWYRQTFGNYGNSDALIMLLGFRKEKLRVGYSYDITVSSAKVAAPGSHEISLSIEWCKGITGPNYKRLVCPDFK